MTSRLLKWRRAHWAEWHAFAEEHSRFASGAMYQADQTDPSLAPRPGGWRAASYDAVPCEVARRAGHCSHAVSGLPGNPPRCTLWAFNYPCNLNDGYVAALVRDLRQANAPLPGIPVGAVVMEAVVSDAAREHVGKLVEMYQDGYLSYGDLLAVAYLLCRHRMLPVARRQHKAVLDLLQRFAALRAPLAIKMDAVDELLDGPKRSRTHSSSRRGTPKRSSNSGWKKALVLFLLMGQQAAAHLPTGDYNSSDLWAKLEQTFLVSVAGMPAAAAMETIKVMGSGASGAAMHIRIPGTITRSGLEAVKKPDMPIAQGDGRYYLNPNKHVMENTHQVCGHEAASDRLACMFPPERTGGYYKNAVFMPVYNQGSVETFLGRFPEFPVLQLTSGMAQALAALWSKGVAHGDIKPHQFFVHRDGDTRETHVVLGDFDHACAFGNASLAQCDTLVNMSTPRFTHPAVLRTSMETLRLEGFRGDYQSLKDAGYVMQKPQTLPPGMSARDMAVETDAYSLLVSYEDMLSGALEDPTTIDYRDMVRDLIAQVKNSVGADRAQPGGAIRRTYALNALRDFLNYSGQTQALREIDEALAKEL